MSSAVEYRAAVRRFSMIVLALAMTVAAAGCGADGGDDGDDAAAPNPSPAGNSATTVSVPPTGGGTTVAPTNLTLRVTDVRLVGSEEADSGMRILLPAGVTTASVTIAGLPSPNRVISVCQARELERRMSTAVCRTPASGEAVTVALGSAASGVEVVQAGASGTGAAGSLTTLEEVTIRYAASSRELNVRLPQIAAGESGGTPSFGLTPASSDGAYRATLNWTVIPVFGGTDSRGQLQLLQGGSESGQAQTGANAVQLTGNVSAPAGDAAIRVRNLGSAAMVGPTLSVLLP